MKMTRAFVALALSAGVAACEQTDQVLPFEFTPADPVSRPVATSGGTVSIPSVASVAFPQGAFGAQAQVTLSAVSAAPASGTALNPYAVKIESSAGAPAKPATIEMPISGAGENAWLASLLVQNAAGVEAIANTQVDLTNGTVRGPLSTLGTVTAVLPPAHAVVTAEVLPSASLGVAEAGSPSFWQISGVASSCNTAAGPCARPAKVWASRNVLELARTMAVVYPAYSFDFALGGTGTPAGTGVTRYALTGQGLFTGVVKAFAGKMAASTGFRLQVTADATSGALVSGSTLTFEKLLLRVLQCDAGECSVKGEQRYTVTAPYANGIATLRIDATNLSINNKPGTLRVELPLALR